MCFAFISSIFAYFISPNICNFICRSQINYFFTHLSDLLIWEVSGVPGVFPLPSMRLVVSCPNSNVMWGEALLSQFYCQFSHSFPSPSESFPPLSPPSFTPIPFPPPISGRVIKGDCQGCVSDSGHFVAGSVTSKAVQNMAQNNSGRILL